MNEVIYIKLVFWKNFMNRYESFLDQQMQFSTHVRSQFQRKKFLNFQTAQQIVENVEK